MPKYTERHPSRDRGPNDYLLHYKGGAAAHMPPTIEVKGSGYYESPEELRQATSFWRSEGTLKPGDSDYHAQQTMLRPQQGALFDADKWERAQATKLARQRLQPQGYEATTVVNQRIGESTIPTSHLQSRQFVKTGQPAPESQFKLRSQDTSREDWTNVGGYYRGPATHLNPDEVATREEGSALVHEMGHRRHLGTPGSGLYDFDVTHPKMLHPDPLKEGVADAYEDRYGGRNSTQVYGMQQTIEGSGQKFPTYRLTGYSTGEYSAKQRGWSGDDRALYAATRAHASETGEQALYTPRSRDVREQPGLAKYGGGTHPTIDATLHGLLTAGPHAKQALRQTDLKAEGAQAFRRHRDRQLLTQGQAVQGSMFHEQRGMKSGKLRGYTTNLEATPDKGWSNDERMLDENQATVERIETRHPGESTWHHSMNVNQFGEKPRTTGDVSRSLGVSRLHAKRAGFEDT